LVANAHLRFYQNALPFNAIAARPITHLSRSTPASMWEASDIYFAFFPHIVCLSGKKGDELFSEKSVPIEKLMHPFNPPKIHV
jgi:hypothetical protein